MTLQIGTRLGHYRIVSLLGRGGMADVYRAEDERLGREVALKALPPEFARDPERVERFEREVRAAARLAHPNIVTVYEFGQGEGLHFYTMELMPGGDLKARIRAHPEGMPAAEARAVAVAMARALDYAHRRGFVHRDVKPENILFDEDERLQLTDFGIARAMASGTRMTATGMSIGSPHYMSPEQARGLAVDGRSDLYSLGVVLYEMLTGRLPFDAGDTLAVAYAHVNDPVPKLPSELQAWQPVVDRLLAKSPEDRYGSAGELAGVLATDGRPPESLTSVIPVEREVGPTNRIGVSGTPLMEDLKLRWGLMEALAGGLLAVALVGTGYLVLQDTKSLERWSSKDGAGSGMVRPARVRPDAPSKPEVPVDFGRRRPTRPKRGWPGSDEGAAAEAALGLDREARQAIQEGLAAAGFDPGELNGVLGPGTRVALQGWQRTRGEVTTGYLTQESAAELRAEGSTAQAAALRQAVERLEQRSERNRYDSLPPLVPKNRTPRPMLPVEPTLIVPQLRQLPDINLPDYADPLAKSGGPSPEPGSRIGTGIGIRTVVGPGGGGGMVSGKGGIRERVYRVGGSVTPPAVLSRVEPTYSFEARKAKLEGVVVLSAIVRKDGSIKIRKVIRSLGLGLDENAIRALKAWRFRPAMKEGKPVDVALNIEVNFRLRLDLGKQGP